MKRLFYVMSPFIISLAAILLAIAMSPWFNLYNNALSDLGHAVKSTAAPVFNAGLVFGGLAAYTVALSSVNAKKVYRAIMAFASVALMLVGVFDEVYGGLHFTVSVLFFVGVLMFLLTYFATERNENIALRALSLAGLLVSIVLWYTHFAFRAPRGAAIPELVSVFILMPFYYLVFYKRTTSS